MFFNHLTVCFKRNPLVECRRRIETNRKHKVPGFVVSIRPSNSIRGYSTTFYAPVRVTEAIPQDLHSGDAIPRTPQLTSMNCRAACPGPTWK